MNSVSESTGDRQRQPVPVWWLRGWVPYLVAAVSLLLTVFVSSSVAQIAREKDQARFDYAVEQMQDAILTRLQTYIAMLQAGAGYFAGSETVTSASFRRFVERLNISVQYPGIQGIGFSERLTPEDRLVLAEREEHYAVIYLEPQDRRNAAVLGYDMFSEPVRREAMARAGDRGEPAASGRVTLIPALDGQEQAGFLMYVPVYRTRDIPATLQERRQALEGFVHIAFRADDLLKGIFDWMAKPRLALQVFDGREPVPAALMHSSAEGKPAAAGGAPRFMTTRQIPFAGHTWTLQLTTRPEFDFSSARSLMPFIVVAGCFASLMLLFITRAQIQARTAAERTAVRLRRSEDALRDNERRFRMLASHAPVGIFQTDTRGDCLFVNDAWCAMAGISPEEALGPGWARALHPDDRERVSREWYAAAQSGFEFKSEYRFQSRQGTVTWLHGTAIALRNASGDVTGYLGTVTDITERKRAQRALQESEAQLTARLKEKDVLLKEVHHRVKNNLQIISSLLSLQSDVAQDARSASLLEDSRHRIRSMALVHEKLYRAGDLAQVEMSSYMRGLADQLLASFKAPVTFQVEADDVVFNPDTAVPCGLILNELLINAIKHAFPDGRQGHVRVVLRQDDQDHYRLTVQDNGVGMPAHVDPASTNTLGLQIVETLAHQLHGAITVERTGGTSVAIMFSDVSSRMTPSTWMS